MSHTYIVPEPLLEKVQRLAKQTSQPIDDIISEHLEDSLNHPLIESPNDPQVEFKAFAFLSDEALFTLMREQMSPVKQVRLSELMNKNSDGTIQDDEFREFETLVEDGERLMLRKSEAMRVLLDRGYGLTLDDMKPTHE